MTNELVVDVQPKEVSIALLEDKSLVELQSEGRNISFSVGNMYLGRIKKLMPGLNACFVDVGYEKDAFLHYLDLGPQFNSLEKFVKQTLSDKKKLTSISKATLLPDLDKDGTVSNTLKVGQEVVVQIVKEPISTKGPRLTSEISFAGRYLVLIPFNDKVSVSQKIKSSEERARLKQLLMSIKPKNFGVIVRTVAEGKRVAELDGELKVLVKHWEDAMVKVQKATKYPTLIYEETDAQVLNSIDSESTNPIPVIYQSGYLTIKGYDEEFGMYRLGFPNREVEEGFVRFLLPYYANVNKVESPFEIQNFVREVRSGDYSSFFRRLQSFFADTTYEVIRDQELHYENVLFIVFKLVGFYTKVEYHTSEGRIDLVLQTDKFIYIMEFKLNGTAEEALQQINDKHYALPFEMDERKLFKIGVNFSAETRNIEKWIVEENR